MTDTDTVRPRIEPTEFPDVKDVYVPGHLGRLGTLLHWPRWQDEVRVWKVWPGLSVASAAEEQRYLELIDGEYRTAEEAADALYAAWLRFEGVEA